MKLAAALVLLAASIQPPETKKAPVADEYHGVKVVDEYRWLEDWGSPDVRAWSEAQNTWAREYLDSLVGREEIARRVGELIGGSSVDHSRMQRRGGRLFAMKDEPPKQQAFLVTLASADDPASARVLVDPNAIDPKGLTTIDWYVPSHDGKRIAVSLSEAGTESGTVHVYDVDAGKETGDIVPRVNGGTAGGDLEWNADGTGFFYTRYPREGERPAEDMDFFTQVYFHKLGTPTEEDAYEIGKDFPRIAEIDFGSSPDGKYVLATVQLGDGGEFMHHLRSPDGKWKQLSKFGDKVISGSFGPGGELYLVSRAGAPRGKILKMTAAAPAISSATVFVPESEVSIQTDFWGPATVVPTASYVFVVDQVGGPNQVRIFDRAGKAVGTVPVPPVCSVDQVLPIGGDEVLIHAVTFIDPPAWYRFAPGRREVVKTALRTTSPADFSDCEVVREYATSKDGTKVPVNIIRRKGTKLDGTNPTIVWGYGGYGVNISPAFGPVRRLWLERGGVYAVANIRGGGEFGEAWHLAGNLTNKQNVFDDFYAAATHMIEAGYTSHERLCIMGGSNGGLLMGATLTQHPDLAKCVVSQVGIYDMLRVELSANGEFNIPEFGTVKNPEHFRAMHDYSPYHNVEDGTAYPAVLFVTGANDPRVDPMQSRKMTARLQAATSSSAPILLRTSGDSGHGASSLSGEIAERTDTYAFIMSQLGVTRGK